MVLKAYKEETFKANIKFIEDGSIVGATFRLPRQADYFLSVDRNVALERQKLLSNIFKSFDKPVQVEMEDGSIVNVDNLAYLIELGIAMDMTDCWQKFFEAQEKAEKEKEKLIKKSKSDGNSTKRDIAKKED